MSEQSKITLAEIETRGDLDGYHLAGYGDEIERSILGAAPCRICRRVGLDARIYRNDTGSKRGYAICLVCASAQEF